MPHPWTHGSICWNELMMHDDVAGVGRIAILREPGGAGIGWITPVSP
jgi:hypothetical protein